jgi:hypothetical protein
LDEWWSILTYYGLGLLDVFVPEQELTVQVAQIDCIKVDDVNLAEAGQDQVLEQFASNAASANEKHSCLDR